ncbi:MAG: hypothetical protein MI862_05420 [Desulfobacterales bacterium]|nr:hypothetical protein [Desulfobacterales bacterium]
MSEDMKKIILIKSAGYLGKLYPPGSTQDWPKGIADELIDKEAADPVLNVAADTGPDTRSDADSETDVSRFERILFAVQDVIESGEVNKDGSPNVEAMEDLLGFNITAEERDKAWETLKNEQADTGRVE